MAERYVFLNHKVVPRQKATASVLDPGFLCAIGLFETMRAYNEKVFGLERHIQRLFVSLPKLGLKLKATAGDIKEAVYLTLKANNLKQARIRLTVWQAEKTVNFCVSAQRYKPYSDKVYKKGFKGLISPFRQNESSLLSAVKSTNYLLNILARRDAEKKGFDEAILLNSQGMVCEGSHTNIFLVKRGKLLTPALNQGCLAGITRQIVVDLARKNKIKIQEGTIAVTELLNSDEAFLTNSLLEIMPLTRINHRQISKGMPGEITRLLTKQYRDLVISETG